VEKLYCDVNKTMLRLVSDIIKENSDFLLAYELGDTVKK